MSIYMDDNFGVWEDMGDPDMRDFYFRVQRESVVKTCEGCGRKVKLRPDYGYCNGCAGILERGGDLPDWY